MKIDRGDRTLRPRPSYQLKRTVEGFFSPFEPNAIIGYNIIGLDFS